MSKKSKNKRWLPWLIALPVLALLVAGGYALQSDAQQGDTPLKLEQTVAGKLAYNNNCASCHGTNLQGTRQGPPFIHKVYEPSHHGDEAFYQAIANGVRAHHWRFGDMPPVSGVTRQEAEDIVAYIRLQQRENGIK